MGDTTTPNLGLVKPQVGASRSTWGDKWNTNADGLDSHYATMQSTIATLQSQVATLQSQMTTVLNQGAPIGAILPWPMFTSWPSGWFNCRGELLAIASYPDLFAIIGTTYGGDGASTFGLPDMRGCALVGYDGGTGRLAGQITPDTPGAIGGAATVALSVAQMPYHQHTATTDVQGAHAHNVVLPAQGTGVAGGSYPAVSTVFGNANYVTDVQGDHQHNVYTDFRGSNQAHGNMQVSMLVMWIIRAI
jgi:microcystin-dependent protein